MDVLKNTWNKLKMRMKTVKHLYVEGWKAGYRHSEPFLDKKISVHEYVNRVKQDVYGSDR